MVIGWNTYHKKVGVAGGGFARRTYYSSLWHVQATHQRNDAGPRSAGGQNWRAGLRARNRSCRRRLSLLLMLLVAVASVVLHRREPHPMLLMMMVMVVMSGIRLVVVTGRGGSVRP